MPVMSLEGKLHVQNQIRLWKCFSLNSFSSLKFLKTVIFTDKMPYLIIYLMLKSSNF